MRIEFFHPDLSFPLKRPLFVSQVPAGFPSPAEDYIERKLDLNSYLISHPAATFFVRVTGNSMVEAGIYSGDLLIVDRSLTPKDKSIVLAIVDGEFTVKRFRNIKGKMVLCPENADYKPLEISEEMNFEVWGVVAHVIHSY